jgi:hypothetical protein
VQVNPKEKPPIYGAFAEPSDGLEPSTPSLPWRFRGVTRDHARSLATHFRLQIGSFWRRGMRRETSGVSFLMCPFCVRALMPGEATHLYVAPAVVSNPSRTRGRCWQLQKRHGAQPASPGYVEARPGPGTNSTSSRRRWSLRFGISAAITAFLSLFVRASSGGFSLQYSSPHCRRATSAT